MIDGIKVSCVGLDANLWRNSPLLDFGISVSESTGEVLNQRREAKYKDMRFILSLCVRGGFSCFISGSLHKYAKGNNYSGFPFADLSGTLDNLTENHYIDLESSYIHGLEIGVNIELPYSPEIVFKKAVCHQRKPFERMDSRDKHIGVQCAHSEYEIKLYNKGYQCKIENKYILRYEIKILKQRILKPYGILTLSDLKKPENVAPLICLLRDTMKDIIFFDYSFKPKDFTKCKLLSWQQYGNPRYWESLDRNNYYKARRKLDVLTKKYNCIDWSEFCINRVQRKWFDLLDCKHINRRHFHRIFEVGKQIKKATISQFKYMRENVAKGDVKKREKKEPNFSPEKIPKRRVKKKTEKKTGYCVSCGRMLVGQKSGSRFCSERIYGSSARKCRNKDSNRRLSTKRKIERAKKKRMMLRITYADNGKEDSVLLAVGKVRVTRKWLDKVKSVERLKPLQSEPTG